MKALCLGLSVLFSLSAAASAEGAKEDFENTCAACHTIGGGKLVGPDLKGLTKRRSKEWIIKFVSDPDKMVQSGDPVTLKLVKQFDGTVMPEIPDITAERIEALIKFIDSKSGGAKTAAAATPAPEPEVPAGDPVRGRDLFSGALLFKNGAPACASCHAAAGLAWPGGGTLGPDLTGAAARLGGRKGLAAWLVSPPSPTMRPIFGSHPLDPLEEPDLAAYLEDAGKQGIAAGPETKTALLAAAGGGAGFMLVLFGATWRRRRGAGRNSSEAHDG